MYVCMYSNRVPDTRLMSLFLLHGVLLGFVCAAARLDTLCMYTYMLYGVRTLMYVDTCSYSMYALRVIRWPSPVPLPASRARSLACWECAALTLTLTLMLVTSIG